MHNADQNETVDCNAIESTEVQPTTNNLRNQWGLTPERIKARREAMLRAPTAHATGSHRQVHIEAIRAGAPSIIEANGGAVFLSANAVLKWLIENGYGRTAKGHVIRGPNAIGDALGDHGLGLPRIHLGGKIRYALTHVDSSQSEKIEGQKLLHNLTTEERRALPYA